MKPLVTEYDLGDFYKLIEMLEGILAHRKKKPTTKSAELFYQHQINYYTAIRNAALHKKLWVMHSAFAPVELLYAFDIVPAHTSFFLGAIAQLTKKQGEYMEKASAFGYPWEVCQGHRPVVGGALAGKVPRPDLCMAIQIGCTNAASSVVGFARTYGVPIYYLDMSYGGKRDVDMKYYVDNLKALISFLEEFTHTKLDWDKFKHIVDIERQIGDVNLEIMNMRKAIPSPVRHRGFTQQYSVDMFTPGTEEALTYFKTVRDEIKENVEARKGPIDTPERYRILSILMPPNFSHKLLDWMEEEHGVFSVGEPHMAYWPPNIQIDPDRPLESLAIKYYNRPMLGQLICKADVGLIPDVLYLAKEYSADGAIFYANVTCHTSPVLIRSVKDTLLKEVGIPTLTLDMDVADPNYTSQEEMQEKIELFLEIMDTYKDRRKSRLQKS
jgi:benzoyl-CoA reductase/2-hydroxyglutaryl-CoA dehydratase subunit BcrC/BadD/HgdB